MTKQKLERRGRILEVARELIAESGSEAITVRELARRCEVSVPTLYNQFGGKDALLAEAVEAHFRSVLRAVPAGGEPPGHLRLLALVDRCAHEMTRLADYHRALLRAFEGVPETESLHQTLAEELGGAVQAELEEMRRRRQLAAWALPEMLTSQITTACISATVVWARGILETDLLRAFMMCSAGLLLLGVARGGPQRDIERAVREAQTALEPALRSVV